MIDLWKASILIIGNEILIGRVLDTNSQKIARVLTMLGYDVVEIRKVGDDVDAIAEAVRELLWKSRVLITTGGLGPTYDDVTAEALAFALGLPLEINKRALEMIERAAEERGLELTRERKKMAIMPKTAKPIPNPVGMAPGIYIKSETYKVFALPGVPKEMEAMLEFVISELEKDSLLRKEEVCDVLEGVREADIAPIINDFAKRFPDVYIKTHPGVKEGEPFVKVCVLASGETAEEARSKAKKILDRIVAEVRSLEGRSS